MIDVSIIIPTYNRCGLLPQALESCRQQTRSNSLKLQIVVVDDCSTDGTRELLREYQEDVEAVFLTQNAAQSNARNAGLKAVSGKYVKFLDSDDVLVEGSLSREVSLAENDNADIVVSGWGAARIDRAGQTVPGTEKRWPAPNMEPLPDTVIWGRAAPTSSALYRRSYIADLEWDPDLSKLDDWDFFCRAALRMGKIVALDEVTYWMREHEGARITNSSSLLKNALEHHRILHKMEETLRERGELTAPRAHWMARYYYKELRVLSLHDRPSFERAVEHILMLDPTFIAGDAERTKYMRLLSRALGFRRANLFHSFVKRRIKRV
ncbi:MAG: glycosyltransferase family 2 protein [Acidobacteriota bacterium]